MFANRIDHFLFAYVLAMAAFLLFRLFSKVFRDRCAGFLNIANTLLLVLLFVNIAVEIVYALQCREFVLESVKGKEEETSFPLKKGGCFSALLLNVFFGFLFQLLFFWKKYRIKIRLTTVSVFLLLFLLNFEYLIIFISQFHMDYVPSSWAVYYSGPTKWIVAVLAVIYFLICWIASGINSRSAAR